MESGTLKKVLVYTLLLFDVFQVVHTQDSTCDVSVPCDCCIDDGVGCSGHPNYYCQTPCKVGYYGIRCTDICPKACVSCNQNFFWTHECYECINGRYGLNCSITCSTCLKCNQDSGFCTMCPFGYYELNCTKSCSDNCLTKICDIISGRCYECKVGYYGDKCNERCSDTCYGGICDRDLGRCHKCVAGYHGSYCNKTCSNICLKKTCNMHTGHCGNCVAGSYGTYCNRTCPSTCKNNQCNRDQGTCTFGCIDNFIGDICDECTIGNYGKQCDKDCPPNCLNGECDRNNGTCKQGCDTGYSDFRFCCANNLYCDICSSHSECARCNSDTYGQVCNQTCSTNCDGPCDKNTGNCDKCKLNYYGPKCETACSETCLTTDITISRCNTGNGYCDFGCRTGYYGGMCNHLCSEHCYGFCYQQYGECRICVYNRYGPFCEKLCPNACVRGDNETVCSRIDGRCLHGCMMGFYGHRCANNCSSGCRDTACNSSTGHCINGCAEGFAGPFCESEIGAELSSESSPAVAVGVSLGLAVVVLTGIIVGIVLIKKRFISIFKRDNNPQITNTYEDLQTDLRDTNAAYSGVSYQNTQSDGERSGVYVNTTIHQTSINTTERSEEGIITDQVQHHHENSL